ncbi:MAG: flagellar basal body L-ring protein FlgH [Deltaproteobacteria bacterium]|nr:flagellar basal body L-ring protein FlgH [Deltaproteobacteria bacterium]
MAVAFLSAACEPRHIRAYTPRERIYDPKDYEEVKMASPESTGSIWSDSSPSLFEDLRASRIGDILTVVIDEKQKGSGDAATTLSDESSMDAGMSKFFGLMTALVDAYPDIESEKLMGILSNSDFAGDGSTSRSSQLEGRIAVRVKKVLPNGDLFVEGHKVILINAEELHFYVSGAIRQSDVRPDNSVSSSLIADAQVEFSGRGVISDKQSPGWLQQLADKYSPI